MARPDGSVTERGGKSAMSIAIDPAKMTRRKLILLVRRMVREAMAKKFRSVAIDAKQLAFPGATKDDKDLAELIASNLIMAGFEFRDFLSEPAGGWPEVETVSIINASKEFKAGIARGIVIGEETNRARHIANMPGGEMTPEILAKHAKQSVKGLPITCTVLDEAAMKRLKMGGVLGVGKGSEAKPCFIVLEYRGTSDKKARPVVLVGKGVTFDTGGINLKPEGAILGMNMDMSGGAAVIHAIAAAARLSIKQHVVALIPAAENMPSGSSYRPGDVIRSMSGKTIEVANTDAEGRIILVVASAEDQN